MKQKVIASLMMKIVVLVVASIFLFINQGCSKKHVKKKPEPPSEWTYSKESVTLAYQADDNLNEVDGKQHTLLLVIYQLNGLNAFNRLAAYTEGVDKLLSAESFDASVMSVNKAYIEPGTKGTLKYDRAENAKHIGVIAGYYNLIPSKSVLLTDIQYESKRTGMLKLSKETVINPLTINIVLGKDGLRLEKKDNDS